MKLWPEVCLLQEASFIFPFSSQRQGNLLHLTFPIHPLTHWSIHTSIYPSAHSSVHASTAPPSIHHIAIHALTCLPTPSSIQQMFSVGINLPHTQALHATSGRLPSLPSYLPEALMKGGSSSQVPGMTGTRTMVGFPLDCKVVSRCGSWVLI